MAITRTLVVTCTARGDGGPAISPCGTDDQGVGYQPLIQSIGMPDDTVLAQMELATRPFDTELAVANWNYAFAMIVGCWAFAHCLGLMIRLAGRR